MAKQNTLYVARRFGSKINKSTSEYNDQAGRELAVRIYNDLGYNNIYEISDDQMFAGYGRPDLIVFTGTGKQDYMIVEVKLRNLSAITYSADPLVKMSKCDMLSKYINEYHPNKTIQCLYIYENDPSKKDMTDLYWMQFEINKELNYKKELRSVINEKDKQWQYIISGHLSYPTTIFSKKFGF